MGWDCQTLNPNTLNYSTQFLQSQAYLGASRRLTLFQTARAAKVLGHPVPIPHGHLPSRSILLHFANSVHGGQWAGDDAAEYRPSNGHIPRNQLSRRHPGRGGGWVGSHFTIEVRARPFYAL